MVVEALSEGKTPPNPARISRGGGGCLGAAGRMEPARRFRRCGRVGTPQHIRTCEADCTHPRRASGCATQRRTRVSRLVRLNRGRGVSSPLLHVSCREAVLNAGHALRRDSLCDANGVAQGAAAKQWDKRPAPRGPGRGSRPSGTRAAGGAGGRKPGPRACPRPRGLGHPGASPRPRRKAAGQGVSQSLDRGVQPGRERGT